MTTEFIILNSSFFIKNMNVLQRPKSREFCATMQDYIIDTDATLTFAVEYGGKKILEEEYVPDAQNQVRVRRLGEFCALALWGTWCDGNTQLQPDAAGTFAFLINDVQDTTSLVAYSARQTRKNASAPGVLTDVTQKVTRPGVTEYASGFSHAGGYILTGITPEGTEKNTTVAVSGTGGAPLTADVSYDRVCQQLGVSALQSYKVHLNGGQLELLVDQSKYADLRVFRFKNVYDMPETLCCTGGLSVKGASEDTTGFLYGVERKFALKVTDEYTAVSGPVYLRQEYKLWHQLLNAREAQIRADNQWLDIVITQQKLERDFRRSALATVEFSFWLADPAQNGLID